MKTVINNIQIKNEELYFLYHEELSDRGVTDKKWHNHSFYEIMFFESGESEHAIENNRYIVKGGDVLLIKPYRHHFEHTRIAVRSSLFCIGFFAEAISNAAAAEELFKRGEHITVGTNSVFAELIYALKNKISDSPENSFPFLKSIIEAALYALLDCSSLSASDYRIKGGVVGKITEYVNLNFSKIQTLSDISEPLFFSKSYVRDAFKKEMGIGIMQYVRNKKVVKAHERIKKGEKPTEIYADCGFSTYSSFYRAFISYFGFSPKSKKH